LVNARDIGEIAAIELIRREQSTVPLPFDRINFVGPDTLTGADVAAIWSEVLDRLIAYGGDDSRSPTRRGSSPSRFRIVKAVAWKGADGLAFAKSMSRAHS
jgi:hypothetical protein